MEERQLPAAIYPAPPPFWKHFSASNISALSDASHNPQPDQTIPFHLRFLQPPPPPIADYTLFSDPQSQSYSLPALSASKIPELIDTTSATFDPATSLIRLTKSLLANFLELTTIMATNPALMYAKIDDIKVHFQNINHIINLYRPHQARESLARMMEEQISRGRREITECERVVSGVEGKMEGLRWAGMVAEGGGEKRGNGMVEGEKGGPEQTQRNGHSEGRKNQSEEVKARNEKSKETRHIWTMIHTIQDDVDKG